MPNNESRRRGPWFHQFMIWVFGIVFAILVFWLEGFMISDIGDWPGPQRSVVEEAELDAQLVDRSTSLREQLQSISEDISARQERQRDLRDSTDSAEKTMNRLLEIQRLALEKNVAVSDQEAQSLAEAKDLFLANQKQYQEINEQIATLREERRTIERQRSDIEDSLSEQRDQAYEIYATQLFWHQIRLAVVKLAVLVPLLIIAVVVYLRWSTGMYVPLIYAFGISTAIRAGLVMHEHFPTQYFKYILIAVAIIIVMWILVSLIRKVARPADDWLIRQYRDAYEKLVCPICDYPIRRGPLRFRYWNRRTVKKMSAMMDAQAGAEAQDELYTCPSCATQLYESCESCSKARPSLLKACPHCGQQREASAIIDAARGR